MTYKAVSYPPTRARRVSAPPQHLLTSEHLRFRKNFHKNHRKSPISVPHSSQDTTSTLFRPDQERSHSDTTPRTVHPPEFSSSPAVFVRFPPQIRQNFVENLQNYPYHTHFPPKPHRNSPKEPTKSYCNTHPVDLLHPSTRGSPTHTTTRQPE